MIPEPLVSIGSITVQTPAAPGRLTRWLLVGIEVALGWQTLQPHLAPGAVEAARQSASINIERVGGRYLTDGAVPMRCLR
jgi:hypothetical protein